MRGLRCLAFLGLGFAACATAEPGGNGGPDATGNVDATSNVDAPGGDIDAPTTPIDAPAGNIDAALQTITLSQSSSTTIVAGSPSCNITATGVTRENSYYRVFRLSDFGVVRPFTAQRVDFGVEDATAGVGTSQSVQVRLHTLNGAFITANLVNVAGQNVTVNNSTNVVLPVALAPQPVIQPSDTLVAEVFVPDGMAAGNIFFIGSNASAETGPSYIRALDCSVTEPATMASIAFPDAHIVLTVTGVF
jgi:hypothetical protein